MRGWESGGSLARPGMPLRAGHGTAPAVPLPEPLPGRDDLENLKPPEQPTDGGVTAGIPPALSFHSPVGKRIPASARRCTAPGSGGRTEGAKNPSPPWGFRGSAVSSHPFCIRRSVRTAPGRAGCQNPGLYPSAAGRPPSTASLAECGHQRRRSAAALPSRFQPRLSFWWVLWRLLQNGAVSFPSPAAGEMEGRKEINTEGLLRAGGVSADAPRG